MSASTPEEDGLSAIPKRENLRRLIELLPERELETAEHVLEGLIALEADPVLRAIREAPEDDEPVTPDEEEALRRDMDGTLKGRVYSHEEARAILLGDD